MNICVIGTGYVGLVVGTCLAESGHEVICVDIDAGKIEALRAGQLPIYEPGLEELLRRNQGEGRLQFATDLDRAVKASFLNLIAVGTPPRSDGSADLGQVREVARGIGKAMNDYKIVATKSTVPVGTTELVRATIAQYTDQPFDVVSNPEFLKEGAAVEDFMKPDRIIIGCDNPEVVEIMRELYSPFVRTEHPIIVMDVRSAELTKYAANALLATKISFMNELAGLCEQLGVDIEEVRRGIGADPRIGYHFLFPGAGYGGSCLPKDAYSLIRTAEDCGYDLRIMKAVVGVNELQKGVLVRKILGHFQGQLRQRVFAIWGLAFKPRTTDMREAPSLTVIAQLLEQGAAVRCHDPKAMSEAAKLLGDRVQFVEHGYEALRGADALVVMTEWNEFRRPNFEKMRQLMRTPVIFDGRNIYSPKTLRLFGFTYYGVGRGA